MHGVTVAKPRPRLRNEWAYLAQVATDIHAKRAASYPARVADGRMSSAEAETALSSIAAIAEDWCVAKNGGVPDDGSGRPSRAARTATLTMARDRANVLADKAATALRAVLPAKAPLPHRDRLIMDHYQGLTMSATAESWVRALDYAAAVAAMLWWEERSGGNLWIVCSINAQLRDERISPDQAKAA